MPVGFDLAQAGRSGSGADREDGCSGGGDGAILVCGRRTPGPRPEAKRAEGLPRAELALPGGATLGVMLEAVELGVSDAQPDMVSNRVMVTVRVPF